MARNGFNAFPTVFDVGTRGDYCWDEVTIVRDPFLTPAEVCAWTKSARGMS